MGNLAVLGPGTICVGMYGFVCVGPAWFGCVWVMNMFLFRSVLCVVGCQMLS